MKRPDPAPAEPVETDPARAYAALAAVEDLDPSPPPAPGLPAVAVPGLQALELVGDLEEARWSDLEGDGADFEALAHRYETLDVEEIEALSRYGEGTADADDPDEERPAELG